MDTLFILDKGMKVVDSVTTNGENIFIDDKYIQDLATGAETFDFSVLLNKSTAASVIEGNYVAFMNDSKLKIFHILRTITEHIDGGILKTCECEIASLSLINNYIRPFDTENMTAKEYYLMLLQDTDYSLGYIDALLDNTVAVTVSNLSSVYSLLIQGISLFGVELEYRYEKNGGRITGKYVDVIRRRGNNTKKRFEYGDNVTNVKKEVSLANFCTAIMPEGKSGLTIKEAEWTVAGGNPVDKPLNQDYISDPTAVLQFGEILGSYSDSNVESPHELLLAAWNDLQKRKVPEFEYDVEVSMITSDFNDVQIGDTVYVVDHEYMPPLYLEARVSTLEISRTNPNNNRCILSNFREIRSGILDVSIIEDIINGKFPIGPGDIQDGSINGDKMDPVYKEVIVTDVIKAGEGEFKKITADYIKANVIEAINASIENAVIGSAKIGELEAKNIKADIISANHIKSNSIEARHITSGAITADKIASGTITSDSGVIGTAAIGSAHIANAAIGNAHIANVSADKLTAGTINTKQIKLESDNKHMTIADNTIQFSDATRVRMQVGEDAQGNYNMYIKDSEGNIIMDALGVTSDGIHDNIIKDGHIADDADIGGDKLNIGSVIKEINDDGTETIKSTKIWLDEKNQSLNTSISGITTKQDGYDISLSEFKQTQDSFSTKVTNLEKDNSTIKTDITQIKQDQNSITSSVTSIKKDIDDLSIGGTNLVYKSNEFNPTPGSADGLSATVENGILKITANAGNGNWVSSFPAYRGEHYGSILNNVKYGEDITVSFSMRRLSGTGVPKFFINGHIGYIQLEGTLENDKFSTVSYTAKWYGTEVNVHLGFNECNGVFEIQHWKLENGNKVTDWSPNPKDTSDDIRKNTEYLDSKIEQTASSITSSVTSIRNDFNNMQVGGTNLIRGTKTFVIDATNGFKDYTNGKGSITTEGGFGVATIDASGYSDYQWLTYHSSSYECKTNESITMSFDVKVHDISKFDADTAGCVNFYDSGGNRVYWEDINIKLIAKENGKWYKVSHTAICSKDDITSGAIQIFVPKNGKISYKKIMVDRGTKNSDWSPAPEDIDYTLKDYPTTETVRSEIKQSADSINMTVSSVNSKLDSLKVGGRNTFKKSTNISKLTGTLSITRQYDKYGFTIDTTTTESKHPVPNVYADDAANKIMNITTAMEFSFDMSSWTTYNGYNHPDLSTFHGSVYVRTKASSGYLASDIVTLNFTYTVNKLPQNPPNVSADDTNNVITGYDNVSMQYSFDDSSWSNGWYPSLSTLNGYIWVRMKETSTHYASTSVRLSFTYSKPKLPTPNVTADDGYNDILGITTEMEFSLNLSTWTKYNGSNLAFLETYNGNVYVRYSETTTHSASDYVTLTFEYTSGDSGGSYANWTYISSLANSTCAVFRKTHNSRPDLVRFEWIGFTIDAGLSTNSSSTISSADYNSSTKITTVRIQKNYFNSWSDSWTDSAKASAFEGFLSLNNITMKLESEECMVNYDDIVTMASASVRLNKVITKNGEWSISGNVKAAAAGVMVIDFCDKSQQSIPVTTSFTRFECTGTVDNYTDAVYNFIDIGCDSKLIFEEVMIENANKCSNFAPAPEDIDEKFNDYDTTEVLESKIAQSAKDISLSVSGTYYTKDEGKATEGRLVSAESSISILNNSITNKVEENGVKSIIQQSPDDIRIGFNKVSDRIVFSNSGLTVKGGGMTVKNDAGKTAFNVDADGNVTMGIYDKSLTISATGTRGHTLHADVNDTLYITCSSANVGSGLNIRSDNGNGIIEWHPYSSHDGSWGYVNMATWTRISSLSVLNNAYITGNFGVGGTKNCIQQTENFGKRKLHAYETAEVYFGDIGDAIITNGSVSVPIDEMFLECISSDNKYHVFTQCYNGSISKIERLATHFIVYGEDGTEFSWELKGKRKGYEHERMSEYVEEIENMKNMDNKL